MTRIGIDIGGSSVKGVQLDGAGCREAQSTPYTRPDRAGITDAVRAVLAELRAGSHGATPAGLCLPGRVSADQSSVELSVNLPVLAGWNFVDMFTAFGLPADTLVCSDTVAAGADFVRSEQLGGRAACIAIGTGVGLAVFDDGEPVGIGRRGIGHLGMVEVRPGQPLEAAVGAGGLRERFGDAVQEGIGSMDERDPVLGALVAAIRMVHAIYVPRHVALLGGVGMALVQQRGPLDRQIRTGLSPIADPDWELHFGSTVFHAARGAARLSQDD